MRHGIVPFSEPSRFCYVRMERSVVSSRNDDTERDMAI